jgi:hypothetical protein
VRKSSGVKRGALAALSHGLNAASNTLFLLVAGATASVEYFGAIAIVYSVFLFSIIVGRALFIELAIVEAGGHLSKSRKVGLPMYSAVVCVVLVAIGAGVNLSSTLLPVAFLLPFVVMQDGFRVASVARGSMGMVLAADVLWLGGQAAFISVSRATGGLDPDLAIWSWVAPGAASGGILAAAAFRSRSPSRGTFGSPLTRVLSGRTRRIVLEFGMTAAGTSLLVPAIALAGSRHVAGLFQAALQVSAPIQLLTAGLRPVLLARMASIGGNMRPIFARTIAVRYTAWAALYSITIVVALAIGSRVGLVLPGVYGESISLFPPMLVAATVISAQHGPVLLARVEERDRFLLGHFAFLSIVRITVAILGAATLTAVGLAWFYALAISTASIVLVARADSHVRFSRFHDT